MKFAEINRKYTEKVAEYIGAGWMINTGTMSGSQGEVAKVDLTDGNRIVRVMLNKFSSCEYEGYRIIVGYANETVRPNGFSGRTLWNGELDVVFEEAFYRPGLSSDVDWFMTKSECEACHKKMWDRFHEKYVDSRRKDVTERCAPVVLSFVRRQHRCKSAKLADVTVYRESYGKYRVYYKDKSWILK